MVESHKGITGSHSTDLIDSGEEGNSTIFFDLLHFLVLIEEKLFSNAGYVAKLHKNDQKSYFNLFYNLHILASDQK